MSLRTATLYLTGQTARDCGTAAQLLGFDSGDAFAEHVLRERLDAMPEVKELAGQIGYAIKAAREKWQAKHPTLPTPGQQAARAVREATQ